MPVRFTDFIDYNPQDNKVNSRESRHREFKKTISKNELPRYIKALSAFANAQGGSIIFGVSNAPRFVVGINEEDIIDEADWTNQIARFFEPQFDISTNEIYENGKRLFVVSVDSQENKPIICKKSTSIKEYDKNGNQRDVPILQEGLIYFRYAGKSTHIQFSELHKIFQERDERIFKRLFDNLKVMKEIGADKVGIVDTTTLSAPAQQSKLYLTKDTAKHLNFVDKGRFTHDADASAYVVAGTVELNEVVEVPVDNNDKILPKQAAADLEPEFRQTYWAGLQIKPNHLVEIARAYGVRASPQQYDEKFVLWDNQIKRWFYRNAFLELIRERLQNAPDELFETFASRAHIDEFEQRFGYRPS